MVRSEANVVLREIAAAHAANNAQNYASDDEAEERFGRSHRKDPFPHILPALLNSADIARYVNATGMLDPFYPEELKPASYEIRMKGDWLYWDESGRPQEGTLRGPEDEFRLPRNAIAFVTLEPMLRIPDYIALRFNLKIRHVYKGLLLGTGPLVDPGFVGRLSLPLHNLTNNDYDFRGLDGLIWMEFTKVSPNPRWIGGSWRRRVWGGFSYVPFDPAKTRLEAIRGYLAKAVGSLPVRSSIPEATKEATEDAQKAAASAAGAHRTARRTTRIGYTALAAFFVGLVALVITAFDSYRVAVTEIRAGTDTARELHLTVEQQGAELRLLRREVQELRESVSRLTPPSPGP